MKSLFTLIVCCLLFAGSAEAQLAKGTRFPALGPHKCQDGRSYDFSRIRKPTMLLLGLSTCQHCRSVLRLLMTRADDYARKGVDVVYMTYESPGRMRRDTRKTKVPAGMRLIADRHYCIRDSSLAEYFPSIYFIDRKGVIQKFDVAVPEEKNEELLKEWDASVQSIR